MIGKKIIKVRLKLQKIFRILQNYLIFNAFFSKILVKSQENLSKKSGKIIQLNLWQPWPWVKPSLFFYVRPSQFIFMSSQISFFWGQNDKKSVLLGLDSKKSVFLGQNVRVCQF